MGNLQDKLKGFYGTEGYHRINPFINIVATDGVVYFAQTGGAFWALDEMLFVAHKLGRGQAEQEPLFVDLVSKNSKAKFTFHDGNGNKFRGKNVPFTDLEEGEYKFYIMDGVILLPSEY